MRPIPVLAVLCLALALSGCGDSNNAFEFKTISAEPSGEKVSIAYDMKPGDGIRMKMSMTGAMEMSGNVDGKFPLDMTMAMTMKCVEVKANGDKVLEMSMDAMDVNLGGEFEGAKLDDLTFKGTVTIDKTGKVSGMEFESSDPKIDAQISQMLKNPGFQYFVPMPEGGMRVGEALDLAKVMPQEALEQLMNQAVKGAGFKPELRGELVLLGTRDIDGERAAEFGVNMVMNLQGEISQGGTDMKMDMGLKIKGRQYSSLKTGFPLGSADWTMEMRADGEAGDMEYEMHMNATMRVECTRL